MPENKLTYKEKNGTTRLGDFLRKLGKPELIKKILTADISFVKDILSGSDLTENQKTKALELQQYDVMENAEITKRWQSDNISKDNFLSKNIRPLVLIYSWILLTVMIFTDIINDNYISLVEILCLTINSCYFGGRVYREYNILKNK